MWAVWLVTGLAVVLFAIPTFLLWPDLRRAPRGWQLLAASGLPLALWGIGFIVRFWKPTPGPYLANLIYPYGTHLNAWAVSFGFMWLAFGLLFFACALRAPRTGSIWLALLVAWVLAWIPHGVIGITFAAAGSNQPSIDVYRAWGSRRSGFLRRRSPLGPAAVALRARITRHQHHPGRGIRRWISTSGRPRLARRVGTAIPS